MVSRDLKSAESRERKKNCNQLNARLNPNVINSLMAEIQSEIALFDLLIVSLVLTDVF